MAPAAIDKTLLAPSSPRISAITFFVPAINKTPPTRSRVFSFKPFTITSEVIDPSVLAVVMGFNFLSGSREDPSGSLCGRTSPTRRRQPVDVDSLRTKDRSEEHTSELQ